MKTFNFLETTDCFNPFFIDGRQIKRIHFFNKSGVIFSTRSGWFGNNNNFRGGLVIPETVQKRKIDFSLCKSFFVSVPAEYYEKGLYADLYLFVDGESVNITDTTESAVKMTDCEIWHYKNFTFDICGKTITENLLDYIEKTPFGEQVEELQKELEEIQVKLDRYEVARILKKYNIVKK